MSAHKSRKRLPWGKIAAVAAGALAVRGFVTMANRAIKMGPVDPALRSPMLWLIPTVSALTLPMSRTGAAQVRRMKAPAGVRRTERTIPCAAGAPPVRIVIYERENRGARVPALLWLHGGGYVLGVPELDAKFFARILERLDIVIVGVDYRLSPDHPYPAPLDDCHTALSWGALHADDLGIDAARIAIGGNSAGGGLAAALAQRVADTGPVALVAQILLYPMLDDRTLAADSVEGRGVFLWTPDANRFGWRAYLGHEPGGDTMEAYAVPARRDDLSGLPPAWIGVGTLDLFHDENADYAARLEAAGVPVTLQVVPRAYHGFDGLAFDSAPARAFHRGLIDALEVAVRD